MTILRPALTWLLIWLLAFAAPAQAVQNMLLLDAALSASAKETGLIRDQVVDHNSDYGETRQISGSASLYNPFLYTGQEYDFETSLYHLRARHYSPSLGRFFSRDPIGYAGGSNMMGYCAGDPINRSDPSGRSFLAANGTFTLDIVAVFNSQREIVKYTLLVTGKTTDARFPSVKANLSVQTTANHTTKDVPITLNDRTGVYPGQSSVIMDALSADIGSLKMFDILVTDLKKAADEGACGVDFALALSRTLDSMFNFTFLDPPVAFRLGLSDGGLLLDENLRPITFLRNGVNVRASRPSDN